MKLNITRRLTLAFGLFAALILVCLAESGCRSGNLRRSQVLSRLRFWGRGCLPRFVPAIEEESDEALS